MVGGAVAGEVSGRTVILPARQAVVCFYADADFRGEEWCVASGTKSDAMPAGWDNAISSIRISPGGAIHVCKDPGLKGNCTIYVRNRPHLNGFDEAISSFRVLGGWVGKGPMPR